MLRLTSFSSARARSFGLERIVPATACVFTGEEREAYNLMRKNQWFYGQNAGCEATDSSKQLRISETRVQNALIPTLNLGDIKIDSKEIIPEPYELLVKTGTLNVTGENVMLNLAVGLEYRLSFGDEPKLVSEISNTAGHLCSAAKFRVVQDILAYQTATDNQAILVKNGKKISFAPAYMGVNIVGIAGTIVADIGLARFTCLESKAREFMEMKSPLESAVIKKDYEQELLREMKRKGYYRVRKSAIN